MMHTKYRAFLIWQHEKEEAWLNKMSEEGLELVNIGFCRYRFKENTKEKFEYKLELLDNLACSNQSKDYIDFMKDSGIEHVGSYFRWAYFKKKQDGEPFEIFSDIESNVTHFKRIRMLMLCITPLNIANTFNMLTRYFDYGSFKMLGLGILFAIITIALIVESFVITKKITALNKKRDFAE